MTPKAPFVTLYISLLVRLCHEREIENVKSNTFSTYSKCRLSRWRRTAQGNWRKLERKGSIKIEIYGQGEKDRGGEREPKRKKIK